MHLAVICAVFFFIILRASAESIWCIPKGRINLEDAFLHNRVQIILTNFLLFNLCGAPRKVHCAFRLPNDLNAKSPIFATKKKGFLGFGKHYKRLKITGPESYVKSNSFLYYACPGEEVGKVKCQIDGTFEKPIKSIACNKLQHAEFRRTNKKCANRKGEIILVVYTIGKSVLTLYYICFNFDDLSVIFTSHELDGKSIKCIILTFSCLFKIML